MDFALEKYSRGRRGAPAKGVGRETGARVQIPPSPPEQPLGFFERLLFFQKFRSGVGFEPEAPGTARGPAKQVQIPPSPPKTPNAFAFGVFLFYSSLFTKAARHRGMRVKSEEVGCAAEHFFHMRACFLWKIRGRRRAAAVPENIPRKPGRKKAAEKSPGSPAKSPVDQRLLCQNSSSS